MKVEFPGAVPEIPVRAKLISEPKSEPWGCTSSWPKTWTVICFVLSMTLELLKVATMPNKTFEDRAHV